MLSKPIARTLGIAILSALLAGCSNSASVPSSVTAVPPPGAYPSTPSQPAPVSSPALTSDLPVWKPEPALLEHLASEVAVQAYRVRPPRDYDLQQRPVPGGQGFAWVGAQRADGTAPQFKIMILTPPSGEASHYAPDTLLGKFLEAIQSRRQNWTQTPTEQGQINRMHFSRARWSGIEPANRAKMHGFSYAAVDGQNLIQIDSQDIEPHHEAALKLAEAAALTFRKQ